MNDTRMSRIRICILACTLPLAAVSVAAFAGPQGLPQVAEQPAVQDPHRVMLQALASAAARGRRAHRGTVRRVPHVKVHKDDHHDDLPLAQAPQRPASERKPDRVVVIAAGKTAAHEVAERDARTERLYRSSQLSAPILKDAKACKRVGAHGESIFENC